MTRINPALDAGKLGKAFRRAGGQRLAITGWLRTDEPLGPFGRLGT